MKVNQKYIITMKQLAGQLVLCIWWVCCIGCTCIMGICSTTQAEQGEATHPPTGATLETIPQTSQERGKYLVTIIGCNDCHTPSIVGPDGRQHPDMSRTLSGHPQDLIMPPAPRPTGPWSISLSATNTAWSGPWGTSFTANLTPDKETGLGNWNETAFIETIRSGRHMGKGRYLLPPMPAEEISQLPDEDLKAIFSYLQSIPAIHNRVPTNIPPGS